MHRQHRLEELRKARDRAHRIMTAAKGSWRRSESSLSRAQVSFDAALLYWDRPEAQLSAVRLMRAVLIRAWRNASTLKVAYEKHQAKYDIAESNYRAYAEQLRIEEKVKIDKARKAGVPELCLDAVFIEIRPDGETEDIYFAAYGSDPFGPGHGHIVIGPGGDKLFERPILAVVGQSVNDRSSRRSAVRYRGQNLPEQLLGDDTAA